MDKTAKREREYQTSATIPLQYDTGFSPFGVAEFAQALSWLKENGFHGAELAVARPATVDGADLRELLDRFGLRVPTLSTGQAYGMEGISLSGADEDSRSKAIHRIKEHADLAAKLGAPLVTVGLIRGRMEAGKEEEGLARFRDSMSECLPYAKDRGVCLILEPINRYETNLLNSCEETARFIRGPLGAFDNIGILYDAFHSNIEDADMPGAIEECGALIRHVHLADSNRGLPGYGHTDFAPVLAALDSLAYDGFFSLETLNLPDREYIRQRAMDGVCCWLGRCGI